MGNMLANWMKNLGGYEVVDEKARKRLDKYDADLPVQFKAVDDKINSVNNDLTRHINAADKKMNEMNTSLTSKIDNVNTSLNQKINNTKTELKGDINDLDNKVNTMNANLSAAISATLINAKNYTNSEVKKEADARDAADKTLQTNINNEATARSNADKTLQTNINNEATARRDADTALEKKINAETSARQSADQLLEQKIAAETKAREVAIEDAENLINGIRNDLTGYYLKEETYSRSEVQSLISAIPKFAIEVVSALPTSNISGTTVYLLKTGDESSNIYTEYIYTNGKWESLGTQKVDLSGYALKSDLNSYALRNTFANGRASMVWEINTDSANMLQLLIDDVVVASFPQGFNGTQFLPLTGGTIKDGNLILNRTSASPIILRMLNTLRSVSAHVNEHGEFGFYDDTNGEWVMYSRPDTGNIYIPHTTYVNDSKVLTSADVTIENGVTIINLQ